MFLFSILISISLTNFSQSYAQCTPDYPEVEWKGPESRVLSVQCPPYQLGDPWCDITFTFYYRVIEDGGGNIISRDIQITEYSYSSECTCLSVFEKMITTIWYNVKDEFEVAATNTCYTDFRVSASVCWEDSFEIGPEGDTLGVYSPCDDTACCISKYKVCWNAPLGCGAQSIHSVVLLSNETVEIECESPCQDMCDEWILEDTTLTPIGKISTPGVEDAVTVLTSIKPNPSNGITDLSISSNLNGLYKIEIFNVQGNKILSFEKNKKMFNLNMPIDLNRYPIGHYYYKVLYEGNIISNGTIIKNK